VVDAMPDETVSRFRSEAERRLAEMADAIADMRRGSAAQRALATAAQDVRDHAAILGFRAIAGQAEWILVRSVDSAHDVRLALLAGAVHVLRQRIAALPGGHARGALAERAACETGEDGT